MTNPRKRGPKCPACERALPTAKQKAAAVRRQQAYLLRKQTRTPSGKGVE